MIGVVAPDGVVQFRAIPYATIPARFKQAVLQGDLTASQGDFTRIGYVRCHQLLLSRTQIKSNC